jgi:hypothetical protein
VVSPNQYGHFKPVEVDVSNGIYRVVGSDEETVTLLPVADANERRIHTGEVVTVSLGEFAGFTPIENPDGNRSLGATLRSHLEMGYWSFRVFLQQLASKPMSATVAILLVIVGTFGNQILPLPDAVSGGLILFGSLGLALIGSGRL